MPVHRLFNRKTNHEYGFDARTTTTITVRLRPAERGLKGRKLLSHLTRLRLIPQPGGHCHCAHDCCGHPVYGRASIRWRKRSEVRVKFSSTPNY